jgi:cell division protease FtsH
MGGRVAEELIFKDVTTGAQNDLTIATDYVQRMVCEYGMSEKIGPIALRKREEEVFLGKDIVTRDKMYSESTAREVDGEVKRIVEECVSRSRKILEDNIASLHMIAEKLIEKEVLSGEELDECIKKN